VGSTRVVFGVEKYGCGQSFRRIPMVFTNDHFADESWSRAVFALWDAGYRNFC